MSVKNKLNYLKSLVIGTALASTTLSSCTNKKGPEPVRDMLTIENVDSEDMYGNSVRLHKVTVPVYRGEEMIDEGYGQLIWGLDNNQEASLRRVGEETHAEKYSMHEGDYENKFAHYYVEVYDDGVLKNNNSLILVNGVIKVIGDKQHYESNLKRYAAELEEKRNEEKRRSIERYRAQQREEARRRATLAKLNEDRKDEIVDSAVTDTTFMVRDTVIVDEKHAVLPVKDSVHTTDTVSFLKKQTERE